MVLLKEGPEDDDYINLLIKGAEWGKVSGKGNLVIISIRLTKLLPLYRLQCCSKAQQINHSRRCFRNSTRQYHSIIHHLSHEECSFYHNEVD